MPGCQPTDLVFEDPSNACDRDNVVTLFDVARLAGVSTATVSRVVHGQDRVREATRIRVQQAIEELGYVPDGAAQSLSRRRKDVIGLVCVERHEQQYDIENMNLLFYDEVLRGVESRIRNHDWSLLITFLQGAHDPSYARIESFTGKVDGILIGEGIVPSPFIERLATRLPVVIFAGTPHEQAVDVVTADNLSGSAAVVTHLIREHGRRRLYWVHGPADSPDSRAWPPPRSPRRPGRCACGAGGLAPGASSASPPRGCGPPRSYCPLSWCCGPAAAARRASSPASRCRH